VSFIQLGSNINAQEDKGLEKRSRNGEGVFASDIEVEILSG